MSDFDSGWLDAEEDVLFGRECRFFIPFDKFSEGYVLGYKYFSFEGVK